IIDWSPPPSEKANAKPTAQNATSPMPIIARILATTLPTFFIREKPTSSIAKPACMKSTRKAATITQIVSTASATSSSVSVPCVTGVSCANATVGNATISSNTVIINRANLRKRSSFGTGYIRNEHSLRPVFPGVFGPMYKHGRRKRLLSYPAGKEGAGDLAIGEARRLLGSASQELHSLDAQSKTLAVLALVHIEVRQLSDPVEAVADGVAVGEEVGGGLGGRGVVFEVGCQGLDELRTVAGVVGDHGGQSLGVERLELLGIILQDAKEELV